MDPVAWFLVSHRFECYNSVRSSFGGLQIAELLIQICLEDSIVPAILLLSKISPGYMRVPPLFTGAFLSDVGQLTGLALACVYSFNIYNFWLSAAADKSSLPCLIGYFVKVA